MDSKKWEEIRNIIAILAAVLCLALMIAGIKHCQTEDYRGRLAREKAAQDYNLKKFKECIKVEEAHVCSSLIK